MPTRPQFDAVIIGAGIAGLYQLYRLRGLGLGVRVYETGSDVGGTWYWNRYPGARFDSESYSYGYAFSPELLEEWQWSEHFAAQPETLRYLQFVADKFDLRPDILFNTRVVGAEFDAVNACWRVRPAAAAEVTARFLITAVGVLSAPYLPAIPGRANFHGRSFHTAQWPHTPVELHGQRVGVIGTGATAVQLITEVAKTVGHLTVFQRTPNYCVPLGNRPIDAATQAQIKIDYPEIFRKCEASFGAFIHDFDPRSALAVPAAERERLYEAWWTEPGFAFWLGNFSDILTDVAANATAAEFARAKIRQRVHDPQVAELLTPRDHPFGSKRVPLESGYYEVYNQDNVRLIDLRSEPIECITERGIATRRASYEFDLIVFATGFDAVTGALNRIDIRGLDGASLKDKWADGPRTYLGMTSAGFPNLFMLVGPHNAASFCNVPRCIEQNVEWVTACVSYLQTHGRTRINATVRAEDAWCEHVNAMVAPTLLPQVDSWFMGANVPGKKRVFLNYAGGAPTYRRKCGEAAAADYAGFELR